MRKSFVAVILLIATTEKDFDVMKEAAKAAGAY
jgi:hypothetical protein